MKFQHQQQKDREEAVLRQQQREQEWYMQKMDMEKQIQANHSGIMQETPAQPSTQSVKLQKYTITPFIESTRTGCAFGISSWSKTTDRA